MTLEVEVRVHTRIEDCAFCRAEVTGSEQAMERVVNEVRDTREADCCSIHGQALAAMVQAQGGVVNWVADEGTEDGMPEP